MADIKLYVCCHRPEQQVPNHPLLIPIQVGAALAKSHFPNFLYDDIGDNISNKNRSYCELTAQYWAWKNVDADYYGFFHYRRYLYPDCSSATPYRIVAHPEPENTQLASFPPLIEQYDLLAPRGENMFISVRDHYNTAPGHHSKDLDLAEELVLKMYPEMGEALQKYLAGTVCYFGNIFMKKSVFMDYCSWLFSILEAFDSLCDTSGYSTTELRVDGYLAERLFGVYYTYHKSDLKTIELPRIHFIPNTAERFRKKTLNFLLPPGSRRRSWFKKQQIRRL